MITRKNQFLMMCLSVCFIPGVVSGQDDSAQESEKKKAGQMDFSIEIYKTIVTQMIEKAELTDEQSDRVKEVVDEVVPKLVRTRDAFTKLLTADQQKTYQAALKLAAKAKYDGEQAHDYAMRKLKLSDEELKEYNEARALVESLDKKLSDDLEALLTDDQKSRVEMFNKNKTAKNTSMPMPMFELKFPNMKTVEDSQKLWQNLMQIEGATEFQPDVENQTARIKVPAGTNLKKELAALEAKGVKLIEGWKIIPRAGMGAPRSDDKTEDASDKPNGSDEASGTKKDQPAKASPADGTQDDG